MYPLKVKCIINKNQIKTLNNDSFQTGFLSTICSWSANRLSHPQTHIIGSFSVTVFGCL